LFFVVSLQRKKTTGRLPDDGLFLLKKVTKRTPMLKFNDLAKPPVGFLQWDRRFF
jgi:hypothetical protein